ncbi:hypothetical protein LCGC14_1978310 [marine sediment metagenome]|uniref:Uncharacterized protein n=1 Tax=marine sediment metagenome TaxID=412755 RepID=A0A0F9I6N5_9ZZZZ
MLETIIKGSVMMIPLMVCSVLAVAVLIDRGGHELPIAADFVGSTVTAPHGKRVQVQLAEHDGIDGVFLTRYRRRRRK